MDLEAELLDVSQYAGPVHRLQNCPFAALDVHLQVVDDLSIVTITRSHDSVTSVVRATRQVNGRRQTYPSHHTHTS